MNPNRRWYLISTLVLVAVFVGFIAVAYEASLPLPRTPPGKSAAPAAGATGSSTAPNNIAGPMAVPGVPPPRLGRTIGYGRERPTLDELSHAYQHGVPPFVFDREARPAEWRLAAPDQHMVAGYAGRMSVLPGEDLDIHLRSLESPVRFDVFRMGGDDARHVAVVPNLRASPAPEARPDPRTGLVLEHWPVVTRLKVGDNWRAGFYLIKVTTPSGADGYIPFVVRSAAPAPLLVVLPTVTYAAYDQYGGTSLYVWPGGPRRMAAQVSFDRPFDEGFGASHFFRLDFPLIAWLEDHGYTPGFATDVDVGNDPSLATGARLVVVSGHSEYWPTALRDAFDRAKAAGVSVFNLGANEAYWQVRMQANGDGVIDRIITCWKSLTEDPIVSEDPQLVTAEYDSLPRPRPVRDVFGETYGGIVKGLEPMVMGPDIGTFASNTGLRPGDRVPGLIGDEVDDVSTQPGALLLGETPVEPRGRPPALAGASAWISPSGSRAFDAGTFDWSWGLDPRYSAGLPGFPADSWSRLMADLLSWGGIAESD